MEEEELTTTSGEQKPAKPICDVCGKSSSNTTNATKHSKTHLAPNQINQFLTCSTGQCRYYFSDMKELVNHREFHHKVPYFKKSQERIQLAENEEDYYPAFSSPKGEKNDGKQPFKDKESEKEGGKETGSQQQEILNSALNEKEGNKKIDENSIEVEADEDFEHYITELKTKYKAGTLFPSQTSAQNPFYPFQNKEEFLFYLYWEGEGLSRDSDERTNNLLKLVHDETLQRENFPTSAYELKKIRAMLLKLSPRKVVEAQVRVVTPKTSQDKGKKRGRKRKSGDSTAESQEEEDQEEEDQDEIGEAPAAPIPTTSTATPNSSSNVPGAPKITVPKHTITQTIQMALSDPLIRKTIRIGDEPKIGKNTEFMDTPFAKNPNLVSSFASHTTSQGFTYELFDDVLVPNGSSYMIGRITQFFYDITKEKDVKIIPSARISCYHRVGSGKELIFHPQDLIPVAVENLQGKAQVLAQTSKQTWCCQKQHIDGITSAWDGTKPETIKQEREDYYSGGIKIQGQTCWVLLFYDKFSSFGSRRDSIGGLYMVIGNQEIRFSSKLECVFLLQLVPKNVEFADVWEPYRQELISLEQDGFEIVDPKHGAKRHYFGRLALMKADSPQRCEFCRHLGARCHLFCPKCSTTMSNFWDFDENFHSKLYHPGYIQAVHKLRKLVGEDLWNKIKSGYGFNGTDDLFDGLNFNAHRQCVIEAYHCTFLGISRLILNGVNLKLKPEERDLYFQFVETFDYPPGIPKIKFSISESSKSYSMSVFYEALSISVPILRHLSTSNEILKFISDFLAFLFDLFSPNLSEPEAKQLLPRAIALLKRAKELFPNIAGSSRQNIHNFLELTIDLQDFLSVYIVGANREESLHKIFKGGLHFTDHKTHLWTVTKVNCVRSFLRYMLHGGIDTDSKKAGEGLTSIVHPSNPYRPHPLLTSLTSYLSEKDLPFPPCAIKKIIHKSDKEFSSQLPQLIELAIQWNKDILSLSPKAVLAKQFEIEKEAYGEKHDILMDSGSLGRIMRVYGLQGKDVKGKSLLFIFFEYQKFVKQPSVDIRTGKPVYTLDAGTSFGLPSSVVRRVLVYHHCKDCKIVKTCAMHSDLCPPICKFSKSRVAHTVNAEYLIDENFRLFL